MRHINDSIKAYEKWLRSATPMLTQDLRRKHEIMAESAFGFLRGSFFRWAETFRVTCPNLAHAFKVLAVGDLHLENFGSWRDAEGRLVWGINDFDEAYPMPFTSDLVRLATSILLATAKGSRRHSLRGIASLVAQGYQDALASGGTPFVLASENLWLRNAALARLKDPAKFWSKLEAAEAPSQTERRLLAGAAERALPKPRGRVRLFHRVAGVGSLGRGRVVALCSWQGGPVAREAKALVPSACAWVSGHGPNAKTFVASAMRRAVRSGDPTVAVVSKASVRRLAPDGSRIDLEDLPHRGDDERLIAAMGFECANVHLGTAPASRLKAALDALSPAWLTDGIRAMRDRLAKDWIQFRG